MMAVTHSMEFSEVISFLGLFAKIIIKTLELNMYILSRYICLPAATDRQCVNVLVLILLSSLTASIVCIKNKQICVSCDLIRSGSSSSNYWNMNSFLLSHAPARVY